MTPRRIEFAAALQKARGFTMNEGKPPVPSSGNATGLPLASCNRPFEKNPPLFP